MIRCSPNKAAALRPTVHPSQPRPVPHFGGEKDKLIPIQDLAIESAHRLNVGSDWAWSCGDHCTHYSSAKNAQVEAFIHPGGHIYPPEVSAVIVRFFRNHPRSL
jgi:polyhydroxybutyrate depolymerase